MILIQGIGAFYALEGAANLVYFTIIHKDSASQPAFQAGRVLRTALGIALILLG